MYIVQFIDGMVMFSVILLIGTGWSFLKPYLHVREKRLLMIVLPMQVASPQFSFTSLCIITSLFLIHFCRRLL